MEIAILVPVITVLLAAIGWLVARNHTLNQLTLTQRDTIDELKRQNDRMRLIDDVTAEVLKSIPQARQGGKR